MRSLILAILLFTIPIPTGMTQTGERPVPDNLVEINHDLSMAFETPHTKWAKPYALGTLRVLFFAPWYQGSTDAREMVELMQRFDLDAHAFHVLGGNRLAGDGDPRWYKDPEAGTKRFLHLTENPVDVFFINRLQFNALPEIVKSKIEELVRDGAGLIIAGEVELPSFVNGAGEPVTENPEDGIRYSVDKGRLIKLPERKKLEFGLGWETELDYQMARQGRALLVAAGREPQTSLRVSPPPSPLSREQAPGLVGIDWQGSPSGTEIRVEIRRLSGQKKLLGTTEALSEGRTSFTLPQLCAGNYQIEAIARSPRGVENWTTAPLAVTSEREVVSVSLRKNWAEIGEIASGTVELKGRPHPSETLRIRLIDKNNRVLDQKNLVPVQGRPTPFEFEIAPWMPMLIRFEAMLLDGEQEISTAHAFLRVTQRHQNQFNFVMWNAPTGDLAPYALSSMAEKGVTSILQGGQPPLMLSDSELAFVPYASSFRASSHTATAMLDKNGVLKNGCVNDEEKMQTIVRETVERHLPSRQHGTLFYSLGDENAVRASCLSDHCLHAYRAYLKEEYGDIESLNQEWSSTYGSFDDIVLLTDGELPSKDAPAWFREFFAYRSEQLLTDKEGSGAAQVAMGDINDEMRALQQGNFARWYDRQAFQNRNYVEWCKRYVKAFREIDPQSLTGFEGTDSFTIRKLTTRSRQGGDLDAFVREMEFFGPYEGPANEVVRSIQPPKYPAGNWIGYSMLADQLLEGYWDVVLNGMNTVQWWRWDNLEGYHGFLTPTFDLFPEGKELLEDTQVVRDGLGDLLMECRIQDDGIAMYYSLPSTYIAHFDGNETYGDYKRDHEIWYTAIHDAGLQFNYVTDRMLRLGEFDTQRYQVLILPLAYAIGEKEAEVIRDFVNQGGTVIADIRPGTYSGHCKPLESGILDDVFGIERKGKLEAYEVDRMRIQGDIEGRQIAMEWGNWHGKEIYPQMKVDPAVAVTTGKPLGQADLIHFWDMKRPVCVVNEFGKGRAILLNFAIYNAPASDLIESLLASAGSTPKIRVTDTEGQRIPGLEITRFKNVDIELVSLEGDNEGKVEVTLPDSRQVFDLKGRVLVGKTDHFTSNIRPHRPSLFALLGKESPRPELTLDSERIQRGSVGKARVRIPGAEGKHAIKVTVATSRGEEAKWMEDVLVLDAESKEIALPVAHNDPEGEWKISLSDLYSGEEITQTFAVIP